MQLVPNNLCQPTSEDIKQNLKKKKPCETRGDRPGLPVRNRSYGFCGRKATLLFIVQELCESRGGRPGLSVLTSLLLSVDVKNYCTVLRHWSQLVPNMSDDIKHQLIIINICVIVSPGAV